MQGGSPESQFNSTPWMTQEQLIQFLAADPTNLITYAVWRNPTQMYQYIRANYPQGSIRFTPGSQINIPAMHSMDNFLMLAFNGIKTSAQPHFLKTIKDTVPAKAELVNWTTSID
jgi:hypothetical protein